jgi:hypothetical protein
MRGMDSVHAVQHAARVIDHAAAHAACSAVQQHDVMYPAGAAAACTHMRVVCGVQHPGSVRLARLPGSSANSRYRSCQPAGDGGAVALALWQRAATHMSDA